MVFQLPDQLEEGVLEGSSDHVLSHDGADGRIPGETVSRSTGDIPVGNYTGQLTFSINYSQ